MLIIFFQKIYPLTMGEGGIFSEQQSSQCEIIFDKEQLKKIITDATVVRKKMSPTKKDEL